MKLIKLITSKFVRVSFLFLFFINLSVAAPPRGFVYLRDVAPTIKQHMMYYRGDNFVGRRISGYRAEQCILTEQAAWQLSKVQKELLRHNRSLIVYDCYRPRKAVLDFIQFSENEDVSTKDTFFPKLHSKKQMFQKGYVSYRSNHSAGSTVDLAIISNSDQAYYVGCADQSSKFEISYGSGIDCLDAVANTRNHKVSASARYHRTRMVNIMSRYGFNNYSKEWWHYTLRNEPFKNKQFDFDVE